MLFFILRELRERLPVTFCDKNPVRIHAPDTVVAAALYLSVHRGWEIGHPTLAFVRAQSAARACSAWDTLPRTT